MEKGKSTETSLSYRVTIWRHDPGDYVLNLHSS